MWLRSGYRKKPSESPKWADLPKHLVTLIMSNTLTDGKPERKTCQALQLVCKSWRAALLDFTADIDTAAFFLHRSTDLFGVTSMLPNVSSLWVGVGAGFPTLYLSPLSAYSGLTRLCLSNEEARFGVPRVDILLLPSTLRHLEIQNFEIDPSCYSFIQFSHLTGLTFVMDESPEIYNFFDLLEYLPKLEARSFSSSVITITWALRVGQTLDFYSDWQDRDTLQKAFRVLTLTSLQIQRGDLLHPSQLIVALTALQKLELFHITTSFDILQGIFLGLPGLSQLAIHHCELGETDSDEQFSPLSDLRSLSLHGMVQTLLPLASKELLSLSCRYHQGIDGLLDLNFIAGLTALTRLELIDFKYLMDLAPLRDIAVKELVILECPRWPAALFVPGALITLQRLHIAHHEEAAVSRAAFMANLRNPASKDHLPAHNLCRLGAIILSLPSLIQLSGKCALFDLGIGEELKGWHRSQYDVLPLSDFDHPSSQYVWNKPAQP